MITSQITELFTEQAHIQALLDKSAFQAITHDEMWSAVQQHLQKILDDSYSLFSNGIPQLSDCEFQYEITYTKLPGTTSSRKFPVFKWYLVGPVELQGGIHRKKFDVTDDNFYISTRPDPTFCQFLIDKKLVEKFIHVS